jgi:hypothetical protein
VLFFKNFNDETYRYTGKNPLRPLAFQVFGLALKLALAFASLALELDKTGLRRQETPLKQKQMYKNLKSLLEGQEKI